jgi:hypothetical protein
MDESGLTYIAWIPVDEHDEEAELPEDEWLASGGGRNVPVVGDSVLLNRAIWTVVHRLWTIPIPAEGAITPRQMCTLRIRKVAG